MAQPREFYERILNTVDDGLWVSDHEDRILFCNAAMRRIAGVELDAIIGLSVIDDFPEETSGQLLPYYARARESLCPVNYEIEVVTPAGRHSVQAGSLSPQVIDGQFAGMICTIQDVTEARHTEHELIEAGIRAQRYLDMAPSIIIALDREGLITLLNQEGGRILGCEPKEALGRNWFATFILPSTRDEISGVFARLMAGDIGDVEDYENEIVTLDGTRSRLIQWHNTLLRDPQGSIAGLLSSGQDITERRQTTQELEKTRTIIDSTTDAVLTTDLEGTVTFANAAVAELYGYEPEELVGQPVSILWREEDMPDLLGAIELLISGQVIRNLEALLLDKQGNEIPALISLIGIRDEQGAVVELLGITKGIRSLKNAQEALKESEERLRAAMDESPFPVAVVDDLDQTILYWSTSARRLFGHDPRTTAEWYELAYPDPDYRKSVIDRWKPFLEEARKSRIAVNTGEYRISCKDGSVRLCEIYAQFIPGNLIVRMNDVTKRKQIEDALRESEEKYRTLVNNTQQGVVIAQANPVGLRFANPAMTEITGYEEHELLAMDEQQLPVLIHADDRQRFFGNFKDRIEGKDVPHQDEYRITRKDGTTRWVSLYSSLIDYFGEKTALTTFVDITERKQAEDEKERLENQLRQALKMEAVGRLAGGVAHDFNNLIMGIMNYADLCRNEIAPDHPSRRWLDEITREANRSANLTRQLLAFARRQTVSPEVINLNQAVGNMLEMLHRLIGENVNLAWEPGDALWSVRIDPSQLDQILANLCVNARDAISGVGRVSIKTQNTSIDRDYCVEHAEGVPGDYVQLAVSDDGCGIDRELIDNVFEPFYTTKDVGKGTGLGLATVYGIVKQNGGFMNVYSEPGEGATFRMFLPRVMESVAHGRKSDEHVYRFEGDETILLVEDEASIRNTVKILLEQLGYTVLIAEDPEAALHATAEFQGPIHLLITDVIMPGMNGRDLAERLLELHASMKVLYMSGYTANVIAHHGILDQGVHFLSKPISSADLTRTVRLLLDEQ